MMYAAWLLIVQVASKCEPRGVLADEDGPLTALDLSDKTGFPEKFFEMAFKHLTAKDIGWLECDSSPEPPASPPATPADQPESPVLNGMEGNGIEEKKEPDLAAEFKTEWAAMPKPFPQPRQWTDARSAALKQRASEKFFRENWRDGLEKVKASDFCAGSQGWILDVDFFLRPGSLAKILEGKYDNKKPTNETEWKPTKGIKDAQWLLEEINQE